MSAIEMIDIENYRYTLPEAYIAKYPLSDRDQSRLIFYKGGDISHHAFSELPEIIPAGSWLVFNNTRVIQARLEFKKPTGARIEIFCLEPDDPVDYHQSFQSTRLCKWKCLVGNAKKWKEGPVSLRTTIGSYEVFLEARITGQFRDSYTIQFNWDNSRFTFGEIIENAGSTPIPPYLNRSAEETDRERYQTIYSRAMGSVAAPTAGLHFTDRMMSRFGKEGISKGELTLHVGAGTFVPVKESDARQHMMHAEKVSVSRTFLELWAGQPSGLIAVGTTTTRSLESLYWLGVKLCKGDKPVHGKISMNQWENESLPQDITLRESLDALIYFCRNNNQDHFHFSTQLMIVPGYVFRTISGLVTNFHLPGSTLLLLIAAFIGDDWRKVYNDAINRQYRFLSYGDSSLLLP
ncbi:MAG: S-adenosylmethionine:tRNA ribosyltransferase-isomerase [Bacteroidales bacterium]|nr:S-adenosylmethionine:tRNA ribosyltransferase-isomerase [Bacteroidales bacterium]